MVVSPHALRKQWTGRGKVYAGIDHDKLVQSKRLAAAGLPTPLTKSLVEIDEAPARRWGEFVIVKAAIGHLGEGVRLLRASEIRQLVAGFSAEQRLRLVVQPYIDHADLAGRLFEYRVLCFFGRLVYATRNRSAVAHAPLAQIAASTGTFIASNAAVAGRRVRALSYDQDVVALGLAAARAFPELPVVATDIIRERGTGRLFVLETNPKGESWHLSSDFAVETFEPDHRAALYTQHGALHTVADVLIDRTRAEAL